MLSMKQLDVVSYHSQVLSCMSQKIYFKIPENDMFELMDWTKFLLEEGIWSVVWNIWENFSWQLWSGGQSSIRKKFWVLFVLQFAQITDERFFFPQSKQCILIYSKTLKICHRFWHFVWTQQKIMPWSMRDLY
jgi:hypothetical protein